MRPRCDRKRCTRKPPCIPIPRACLDSVRIPTPRPYFLPPLTRSRLYIPPSCFQHPCIKRPLCHCTGEDYCTTETCRSSSNCQSSRPQFCPYGPKEDETDITEPVYQQKHSENIDSLKEDDVDSRAKSINFDQQEPVAQKNAFPCKPAISYTPSLTYESDTSTTSLQLARNHPTESINRDVIAPTTQNNEKNKNFVTEGLLEPSKQAPMKVPSAGTCHRSQLGSDPQTSQSPRCDRQHADAMTETDYPNRTHPTQNGITFRGQDSPHRGSSLAKQNEQGINGSEMIPGSLNGRSYANINANQLLSNGQMVSPVKNTVNASCQTSFIEVDAMTSNLLPLNSLQCTHNVPYSENTLDQNPTQDQKPYQSERLLPNHQGFAPNFVPTKNSNSDISSDNSSIQRHARSHDLCINTNTKRSKNGDLSTPKSRTKNNNLSVQKISKENRLSPKDSLDVITANKPHLVQRRKTSSILGELDSRNNLSRQNYAQPGVSLTAMPNQQNNNQSSMNSPLENQKMPVNTANEDSARIKQNCCRKGGNLHQIDETEHNKSLSNDRSEQQTQIMNSSKQNMPVPNLKIINVPPTENINEKRLTRTTCCDNGSQTCESCAQPDGISSGEKESTSKLRRSQVPSMQLSQLPESYGNLDRASLTSRISKKGSRNKRPWYGIDIESQFGCQKSKTSQITCLCPEKSADELSCSKRVPCTREVGLSACASTSCAVKVKQRIESSGCSCCYPPAFSQLSCAGNINGTCSCSENAPNKNS